MPLIKNNTQTDEAEDLQHRLIQAFACLRKKHPIVGSLFASYKDGRSIEDFYLFSPSSFSHYLNQYGQLLTEIFDEKEMEYYKKQLKYYKGLMLIHNVIAEDPSIMDEPKDSEELRKILLECRENTFKLHAILSEAINRKIAGYQTKKFDK